MEDPLPRRISWFAPWTWKRRWWVVTGAAVLIAYPLSIGPSLWMVGQGWLDYDIHCVIYRPIHFCADNNSTINDLLCWYVDLFSPEIGIDIIVNRKWKGYLY